MSDAVRPPSDCAELVAAALVVCDRWDTDPLDVGAMDRECVELRRVAEVMSP